MDLKKKNLECCNGAYHIEIDGTFYCMAPPNYQCSQQRLDAGKFTRGKKTICYCKHPDIPCSRCACSKATPEQDAD